MLLFRTLCTYVKWVETWLNEIYLIYAFVLSCTEAFFMLRITILLRLINVFIILSKNRFCTLQHN